MVKRIFLLLITAAATSTFISNAYSQAVTHRKVLVMPREGSGDIELMVTKELSVMISMLKSARFEPVVASASGKPFVGHAVTVKSDLKLTDVKVSDYLAVLVPCMAAGEPGPMPEEAIKILADVAAAGKPVAAPRGAIWMLSQAGLLKGRKYAYLTPSFPEGVHSGNGVVQDGNIITSAVCPFQASLSGLPDGTTELTQKVIALLAGGAR